MRFRFTKPVHAVPVQRFLAVPVRIAAILYFLFSFFLFFVLFGREPAKNQCLTVEVDNPGTSGEFPLEGRA